MRLALVLVLSALLAPPALAQDKPDARASKTIQDCIKTKASNPQGCIGLLSHPCLDDDKKVQSTADMVACSNREQAIWDDILNETYRRLRAKLDDNQQIKLRDMQRAWLANRKATCSFYWDFFQGTMASPMSAQCVNKETAQRALFLLGFLDDAEGR